MFSRREQNSTQSASTPSRRRGSGQDTGVGPYSQARELQSQVGNAAFSRILSTGSQATSSTASGSSPVQRAGGSSSGGRRVVYVVRERRDSGTRNRSNSPREEEERRYRERTPERRASTSYVAGPSTSYAPAPTYYSPPPTTYAPAPPTTYAPSAMSVSPRNSPGRWSPSTASSLGSDDYYGTRDFDRTDGNYVTSQTMQQNPPGRRALDQNTVMGASAASILTDAGRPPTGPAAHLHTAAAYAHGDGVWGQTQRVSNLTPGSQATNLDHKRYEDRVARDGVPMLGAVVIGAGMSGDGGTSSSGYPVYNNFDYESRGPDGRRIVDSHEMGLHDYRPAAERRGTPGYPSTADITSEMRTGFADHVMDSIPEDGWDSDYKKHRHKREHHREHKHRSKH